MTAGYIETFDHLSSSVKSILTCTGSRASGKETIIKSCLIDFGNGTVDRLKSNLGLRCVTLLSL